MLTESQKNALLSSWELVLPIAETAADLFYKRLFELQPSYRKYFPSDMAPQKRKLIVMLKFIVKSLDWAPSQWRESVSTDDDLFLVVLAMGRRHSELYKIPDASYPVVGEALIWTLDYGLGEAFTPEVREAWTRVYGTVAKSMMMGKCAVGGGSVIALRASDG